MTEIIFEILLMDHKNIFHSHYGVSFRMTVNNKLPAKNPNAFFSKLQREKTYS